MPLYKIGEEVTLVPKDRRKYYRCGYVEDMAHLAGRKGHIIDISPIVKSHSDDFPFIVDPYGYTLDLPGPWTYSAEMFEESYEM